MPLMSTLPPTIQHTALSSVLDMGNTPSEAVCLYALLCYCLSPPLLIEAPLYRAAENNNKQIRRVMWGGWSLGRVSISECFWARSPLSVEEGWVEGIRTLNPIIVTAWIHPFTTPCSSSFPVTQLKPVHNCLCYSRFLKSLASPSPGKIHAAMYLA